MTPQQLDLLAYQPTQAEHAGARKNDPVTSKISALGDRSEQQNKCLAAHRSEYAQMVGGLTDEELSELTGIYRQSASKRRGELRDKGLLAESGLKRATSRSRPAIVWTLTEKGRQG